jgi:hypothetical protein
MKMTTIRILNVWDTKPTIQHLHDILPLIPNGSELIKEYEVISYKDKFFIRCPHNLFLCIPLSCKSDTSISDGIKEVIVLKKKTLKGEEFIKNFIKDAIIDFNKFRKSKPADYDGFFDISSVAKYKIKIQIDMFLETSVFLN